MTAIDIYVETEYEVEVDDILERIMENATTEELIDAMNYIELDIFTQKELYEFFENLLDGISCNEKLICSLVRRIQSLYLTDEEDKEESSDRDEVLNFLTFFKTQSESHRKGIINTLVKHL